MTTPRSHSQAPLLWACLVLVGVGCDVESAPTDASMDAAGDGTDSGGSDAETVASPALPDLFDASLFAASPQLVDCVLDNGVSTECYRISFANYLTSSGPFCPETVDDIGGVGIYDGATNPGFQVLARPLWEAMEADGFDILDEAGNVRQNAGMGAASCLNMGLSDLTITFLIPAHPQLLATPNIIDVVELWGVALEDGMPLTGHPPSVVDGPPIPGARGGGIPSLDPCGGHPDPAGYWHWHFTPNNVQSVLDGYGITEVSCTDIAQRTTGLVGFAKDGFPIYGPLEGGAVPTGLDACNGRFGVTDEFPAGVYHYYALNETAPNLPTCIMGASVRNPMSVE